MVSLKIPPYAANGWETCGLWWAWLLWKHSALFTWPHDENTGFRDHLMRFQMIQSEKEEKKEKESFFFLENSKHGVIWAKFS